MNEANYPARSRLYATSYMHNNGTVLSLNHVPEAVVRASISRRANQSLCLVMVLARSTETVAVRGIGLLFIKLAVQALQV